MKRLGDYLSDHHDLAILRRGELRLEAKLLGERVYAVTRLAPYWQAWRDEHKSKPAVAHSDSPNAVA